MQIQSANDKCLGSAIVNAISISKLMIVNLQYVKLKCGIQFLVLFECLVC